MRTALKVTVTTPLLATAFKGYLGNDALLAIEGSLSRERDRLLLRVLAETGCTLHELLGITAAGIGRKIPVIAIRSHARSSGRKRGITPRAIPVSWELHGRLKKFFSSSDFISFSSAQGKLTERRVQQILLAAGKQQGIHLTPRLLRSHCAIRWYFAHVPINEIESRLGVQSVQAYLYKYLRGNPPLPLISDTR